MQFLPKCCLKMCIAILTIDVPNWYALPLHKGKALPPDSDLPKELFLTVSNPRAGRFYFFSTAKLSS